MRVASNEQEDLIHLEKVKWSDRRVQDSFACPEPKTFYVEIFFTCGEPVYEKEEGIHPAHDSQCNISQSVCMCGDLSNLLMLKVASFESQMN